MTSNQDGSGISPPEIFEMLGNKRRRLAIAVIADNYGMIEFRDLVRQVAILESGQPPEEIDRELRESIKNSLYQTHLPQLNRAGVIDQVRKSGMIRAEPAAKQVFRVLEHAYQQYLQ